MVTCILNGNILFYQSINLSLGIKLWNHGQQLAWHILKSGANQPLKKFKRRCNLKSVMSIHQRNFSYAYHVTYSRPKFKFFGGHFAPRFRIWQAWSKTPWFLKPRLNNGCTVFKWTKLLLYWSIKKHFRSGTAGINSCPILHILHFVSLGLHNLLLYRFCWFEHSFLSMWSTT